MRTLSLSVVVFIYVLAGTWSADAQATRTWISGVGDDVNPCSRTAPCKTFAGAISKTAAGGEINCLDPGGFGAVTITRSITLDCSGTFGSILAAGTGGVIVNAPNGVVNLRGIAINGAGTGTNGIRVADAKRVTVENVAIDGFTQSGIAIDSSSAVQVVVRNSSVRNNTANGISSTPAVSSDITVANCLISGNGTGINAGPNAAVRIADNTIVANATGLQAQARGKIVSLKNNLLEGNATNGAPTSFAVLQ